VKPPVRVPSDPSRHKALEELGFEQSFVNAFGTSHTAFLKEFDAFIETPRDDMLAILAN